MALNWRCIQANKDVFQLDKSGHNEKVLWDHKKIWGILFDKNKTTNQFHCSIFNIIVYIYLFIYLLIYLFIAWWIPQ